MSIVVATPTGHIGSALVQHLLEAGADLVVLARDPSKLTADVRARATVRQGVLEDAAFVAEATQGAEALFWLTPSHFGIAPMRAWFDALGQSVAGAVRANGIPYVVNLSSWGANHREGLGPVSGLGQIEDALNATGARVLHLRPGFFFENFAGMAGSIAGPGHLYFPAPPETRLPMVATRDIAAVAAQQLLARDGQGVTVLGIHGPADLSYAEAAAVIGEAVGRPVVAVQVPREGVEQMFQGFGAQGDWPVQMADLYSRLGDPAYPPTETRTAATTTATPLAVFAAEVIAPAVRAQAVPG